MCAYWTAFNWAELQMAFEILLSVMEKLVNKDKETENADVLSQDK